MSVKVSHPEKVLFPQDGYTKQDMVDYYLSVADAMLPYLRDHPVAMLRFNQGIEGERFFHKNAPEHFPDFIPRAGIPTSKRVTKMPVVNDRDALAYIANHNTIEFHALTVRADDLGHPDRLVFDLDPSVDDFEAVRRATHRTHDLLDELGLACFAMTSGSRGMHIWAPLDRSASVEEALAFAGGVAEVLVARYPDELTTEFTKADRGGRIYLDVARNAPAQHAVTPWSLRAKPGAPVAMPIAWDELDDPDLQPQRWTMTTAPQRAASDPWKGMRRRARSLRDPARRLSRLAAA